MNAMDLQLSVFQKTGIGTQSVRPLSGTSSLQRPSVEGGHAPSFSDVLATLTRNNETLRTAPASGRLRALEASVAANQANAASFNVNTSREASAATGGTSAASATEEAENNGLDLSTKDARKILRDALNSDSIPTELLTLLTDDDGDFSDDLLDLILAEDEEENTEDLGLGSEDVSDQLTSVLTDAKQAQELLSTQSGRDLISAMAERSIAGLVTA